ncbi:MAG: putative superfamily, multidrug transport protein [Dehalococcoidia bacterium]|nr:putative superfamily, multidrug transport protein [Dehalococcoidia bacterium]
MVLYLTFSWGIDARLADMVGGQLLKVSLKEFAGALSSNPSLPILYVTTIFMFLGQGVISPILPLYASEFGVGTAMIGVVVGAFGMARLIVNLPAGIVAERYGRRILLVGGPAIGAVSSLLVGLAGSFPELIAYRVMYGVGSAMYMTGSMTFIARAGVGRHNCQFLGLQGALLCSHRPVRLQRRVGLPSLARDPRMDFYFGGQGRVEYPWRC